MIISELSIHILDSSRPPNSSLLRVFMNPTPSRLIAFDEDRLAALTPHRRHRSAIGTGTDSYWQLLSALAQSQPPPSLSQCPVLDPHVAPRTVTEIGRAASHR